MFLLFLSQSFSSYQYWIPITNALEEQFEEWQFNTGNLECFISFFSPFFRRHEELKAFISENNS